MTLEKTNKLLTVQALMGGGYNRNGANLILNEVQREHSQQAVDPLISTLELKRLFGFTAETEFRN
ncbi:MAG: hypothetical protein GXP13_00375 [Gammaproteobacteria bacterium]|nr:hypothetical protein [Gammaproteobacteria bacterium]